jgi:hypothetical protein
MSARELREKIAQVDAEASGIISGISLAAAEEKAFQEMGRPVKAMGFEERIIGPHVVNVFYYSVEYPETGTMYRAEIYENGRKNAGVSFG